MLVMIESSPYLMDTWSLWPCQSQKTELSLTGFALTTTQLLQGTSTPAAVDHVEKKVTTEQRRKKGGQAKSMQSDGERN